MKIVCIVPVKSTSSRIKNKNIKLLGNKPLFLHTLKKLLEITLIDEVWIDTDDIEIVKIAENYGYNGFKYFIRKKEFATNKTDGNKLLENEIDNIEADIYIQVLCTSPFTKKNSIEKCCDLLKSGQEKSVVGCYFEKLYLWNNKGPVYDKNNIPNSNNLENTIIESMSIYGITKDEFQKTKLRIGTNPFLLNLDNEERIDINYQSDFDLAEKIAKFNNIEENRIFNNLKLKLNSCILSDILNELGYENCVLQNFKLNLSDKVIFGRIRPIQIRKLHESEDPNDIYHCLKSYNNISHGDIIFVNNKIENKAYFGDLNATLSIVSGAQGTIINGFTRDIERTKQLQYPVFYKTNTCSDVKLYGTLDYFDKPIVIDGLKIFVNDLVFADIDGVVIIPREIEKKIIEKSINTINNESNISSSIICGKDIYDIINSFGNF
jgi:CMP-N-acetylneuraminic acid synthetase/regulator of RNase E activity RraA